MTTRKPKQEPREEKPQIEKIIKDISNKISRKYKPQKIILFGSYAHGKPKKDSDVDLLIIKETNERHIDRNVKVRQIVEKENKQVAIDILVYNQDEIMKRLEIGDDFIKGILENGITLYG